VHRDYGILHSQALGRDMEHLVIGHAGAPVLVFPTSRGRFFQWEDFNMIRTLQRHLENGWIQLFCVDSVDRESWYNFDCEPAEQVARHNDYDRYLVEEFLPFLRTVNNVPYLTVTGTSFGAFHAALFAFRHPQLVQRLIAMSGDYCVRKYLDDHYDIEVYYNNPVDFLPRTTDPKILESLRKMDIVLAAGDWDFCLGPTVRLARILDGLEVPYFLDVWGDHTVHDWPTWKRMIVKFI